MLERDAIKLFNLKAGYSKIEVDTRYRELMKTHHPDLNTGVTEDVRKLLELKSANINLAKEVLDKSLQEQARQEQVRQEQAKQEHAKHEQARQEQVKQEHARQEQARQEESKKEQARQEHPKPEQAIRRYINMGLLIFCVLTGIMFIYGLTIKINVPNVDKPITKVNNSNSPNTEKITFKDINLEKVIRESINKSTDYIYVDDVKGIKELQAFDKNIVNLSGIENLTNLTKLSLINNQISDIEQLRGLTNLTELDLTNNQIINIEPLRELTNLTELTLGGNQINDYTPTSSYYENLWRKDFSLQ